MARFNKRRKTRSKGFDPRKAIARNKNAQTNTYQIQNSFSDFSLLPTLTDNIAKCGFTQPTAIQDRAIPEIISGHDVVGVANTGTGKTAAFLIPAIQQTAQDKNHRVLIVTPTRELAQQINKEFVKFAQQTGVFSVVCIGGVSIQNQIHRLQKKPQFIIGTPGRLLDLEKRNCLDMSGFKTIVLDEVDRMLDMGFIRDIEIMIEKLPAERQSLFFSATVDEKMKRVIDLFVTDPVLITVKTAPTSTNVTQEVIQLSGRPKKEVLSEILKRDDVSNTLVFVRTKRGCDKLHKNLTKDGFKTTVLHGNKSQNQRQRSLDSFKHGHVAIMIATDVASRGLDVHDISHVINHDLPETYDDYIHRIGRTGRADKKGTALTFV